MKKLVLFLAVAFAAAMVSCGGSEKAAEAADSTAAVVEEAVVEVVDTTAADTAAADTVVAVEVAEVAK